MQTPLVSVLIPAYNSEKWITETLDSVLKQTWPAIEIIIVDDGSTDNTLAAVEPYRSERIKVINQRNKGAGAARNTAFKASTGEYIQYLDADDLLDPDKIERQMHLLLGAEPNIISSSAWGMFYDKPLESDLTPNILWQNFESPVDWLLVAWTHRVWMPLFAWLTPRNIIEQVGPWYENLSLHDDGEFFCRALLKSKGVKFCPEAKSYYRKGILSSLSSQRSLKAIQSHYTICELYEQHLISFEDTFRIKNACAANYQSFIYDHYPYYPELLKKASLQVKRLGGTSLKPMGSPMFMKLKSLFGWKLARRMEEFAYSKQLNRSAIKNNIKNIFRTKD